MGTVPNEDPGISGRCRRDGKRNLHIVRSIELYPQQPLCCTPAILYPVTKAAIDGGAGRALSGQVPCLHFGEKSFVVYDLHPCTGSGLSPRSFRQTPSISILLAR